MLHVTLLFLPLLPKLWAVLYRQTSCCYSHWQQWKGWSDLFKTSCLAVLFVFFFFIPAPLSSCPHYSVRFLEILAVPSQRKWGISDSRRRPGAYFPFLPLYLSATFFFSFTICFVCLGWIKTETVECLTCAGWWEPLRRVQRLNVPF